MEYITTLVSGLLESKEITIPNVAEIEISKVITYVCSLDYANIIKSVELTNEKLTLTVNVDSILTDIQLGDINAEYNVTEKAFKLSVYGVDATITGNAIQEIVAPENAVDIKTYVDSITEFIKDKSFNVVASYENIELGLKVAGEIYVNANIPAIQGTLNVNYNGLELPLEITYINNEVYVKLYDIKVKASVEYITTLVSGLLESKEITIPNVAEIEISKVITYVCSLDYANIIKSVELTNEKLTLTVNVDSILTDIQLGDINAEYNVTEQAFKLSVYGVDATITGKAIQEIVAPENAVDIKTYVDSITEFVKDKSFNVVASYENSELGLKVAGEIYINANIPAIQGTLNVNYNEIELPISIIYVDGVVYVQAHNVRIKSTIDNLLSAITKICEMAGITLPETKIDFDNILSSILELDIDTILRSVRITNDELSLELSIDELLDGTTLGIFSVKYDLTQSLISLSGQGVSAKMQSVTVQTVNVPEDVNEYVDLAVIDNFLPTIDSLLNTKDIAFNLEFATTILQINMNVALSGEIKFDTTVTELYLKADIFVEGYADETLEILFKDGLFKIVYKEYAMQFIQEQVDQIAQSFTNIFAKSDDVTTEGFDAAMLLFSTDGINLSALIESLTLSGNEVDGLSILSLMLDLGAISGDLPEISANVSTDGAKLSLSLNNAVELYGLPVNALDVDVWAANNEFAYDFSGKTYCENIFEFVLHAYTEIAQTNYLNIAIAYDSELIDANINGLFEFVPVENSTAYTINFDVKAEVHTYKYDENNTLVSDGSHYLNMVTIGDMSYISYSLFGYNAENALFVEIPVAQLFEIGEMALPLLMPILGITEDAFYYDIVTNVLAMTYNEFTTDLISAIQFEDLLKLLDGIAELETGDVTSNSTASESVNISEMLNIFNISKNEKGETVIAINNIGVAENETLSLALTAQKEGEIAVVTSVTTSKGESKVVSYIDLSSIATLLNDVLNAYEYADTGYEISGKVNLSILGINLKLELNINLKVGIDEEGKIFLNAKINVNEYENGMVLLLFGTKVVINGNAETDITFKDGNIYMTRHVTSEWGEVEKTGVFGIKYTVEEFIKVDKYEYRKMPVSDFGADIMNHLFWALNLSEGAKNYISKEIEKSESNTTDVSNYDAGQMVKSYSMPEPTKEKYESREYYNIILNVGAIANDSALGDLSIDIIREKANGADYYDLTKLVGSIKLVSIITATFDLTHETPGNQVDFSIVDTNISRVNANV